MSPRERLARRVAVAASDAVADAVVVAEKTATTKNAGAGLRAAANVAMTTSSADEVVIVADPKDANAVAPKATVVELATTKNADEVVIADEKAASAKKAVAARASTAKRS